MKPKISKNTESIRIGALDFPGVGQVGGHTIDLVQHAGQMVRVWLDRDGSYSTDPRQQHLWQIAEFQVPERQMEAQPVNDPVSGEETTAMVALPLDLSAMQITTFDLPVGA